MSGPPDFERLYQQDTDPWRVGTTFYEQRKIDLLTASLSQSRYRLIWDLACGTGHLTKRLAARSDAVRAADLSSTAVRLTAERCRGLDHVTVVHSSLPDPPGTDAGKPDLIVLSEVFYYLDDHERAATIRMITEQAAPQAEVVAVHWRFVPDDAWLGGAGAQQEIVSRLQQQEWRAVVHLEDPEFVLDSLITPDTGLGEAS